MEKQSKSMLNYVLGKIEFPRQKIAGIVPSLNTLRSIEAASKGVALLGVGAAIPLLAMTSWKNKIQNDTRRKALIEDLYTNDSIIKQADREEVLRYYATIIGVAPSISLDKNVVRELLQNFIKFGRVDIQTIKTLADTERSIGQNKSKSFGISDAVTTFNKINIPTQPFKK